MRNSFTYILLTAFFIFFSCSEKKTVTPEENFYFEIKVHKNDKYNSDLAKFLNDEIPKKKYTITNSSGLTWPYYAEIDLDETISIDSLMPPHWYLHKMITKDLNSVLEREDHLVKIDLMPQPDTTLNYSLNIYLMDSTGLSLAGTSGIHFVDSTEFLSRPELFDYYLKSIIRYSFK